MKRILTWFYGKLRSQFMAFAIATVLLATVLSAVGLALDVDPRFEMIAHYLTGADQARAWREHPVWWWLATLFFIVDAFIFVPAYGALLIGLAVRLRELAVAAPLRHTLAWLAIASTVGAVLADEVENLLGLSALLFDVDASARVFAIATWLKFRLFGAAFLALFALLLLWFFGAGENTHGEAQRAVLRRHVSDIVWRSRYIILGLLLFAGLILVMDQSRDVLVGVAQAWEEDIWVRALIVMGLSIIALWALAHTSWVWCRILSRMRRPRVAAVVAAQPRAGDAAEPSRCADAVVEVEPARGVFLFARWWARLLGTLPVIMLIWLCGLTARDAARANAWLSAWILLVFGVLALIGAFFFLWRRASSGGQLELEDYFDKVSDTDVAARELVEERYSFLWLPATPLMLPVGALIALTLVRLYDLLDPAAPSLSFVVICLSMALWTGVAAFLSQLALRHGRPYIVMLLVAVAVLGVFGCTDNHVVWRPFTLVDAAQPLLTMWAFHALLVAVVIVAAWAGYKGSAVTEPWGTAWTFLTFGDRKDAAEQLQRVRMRNLLVVSVGAILALFVIVKIADYQLPRSLTNAEATQLETRPTVRQALVQWLKGLCAERKCDVENAPAAPFVVYFVSTEGGGIRAAYWTALVLAELSTRIPEFDRRTFSISGVSGGAIGAAIYRTCKANPQEAQKLIACVQNSQRTNWLTPLLSAWMFEDILARIVPTSLCKTPGCGILSRGAWFEQTMEVNLKDMRKPLAASREGKNAPHLPYLFLNSTWVETGERAIASDITIEHERFPTARDQLAIMGEDLPTSTAAHNAARFPYVNAIGSLRTSSHLCPMLDKDKPSNEKTVACGHLADGGYFDNSGGHTTGDVLRALAQLLRENTVSDSDLTPAQKSWLRENLVPQVLMIRNGVGEKEQLDCDPTDPSRPRCKGRFALLTDLLGPPVTAFNAIGTGANGRVAESLLEKEALLAGARLSKASDFSRLATIDLNSDGVLYPLGWYLSLSAQCGMERQARIEDRYKPLCMPGDLDCANNIVNAPQPEPRPACERADATAAKNRANAAPGSK